MAEEMNKLNVQAGFTVTDEESGLNEIKKIKMFYDNMINDKADPIDIVADFYKMMNNETLDDKQEVYLKKMIEKVWNK